MSDNPLSGKVGLDTTDFKSGIAELNRQIRVIESGFRATAAGMQSWATSASGLEARIKSLNSQIGLQQQKVSALQSEYQRVAAEQGANSRAAENLQIRLNKETETLNKMQSELSQTESSLKNLGKTEGDAGNKTQDLKNKEDQAVASTNRFKTAIGGLGGAMKSAVTHIGSLASKVAQFAMDAAKTIAMVGGAAALAVGGLLASTIKPASDLAETANKVQVVFGDATGQINQFASGAATALGQSKQAALDAAATFGVFGKSAGLSGPALADFSTNLVGLSGDLASFYNTSPEEAMQAISAALRGESEPIRRYGVLLDDATLRQKAFEMGITRTTKEALTPQQKVLAAQAVIMQQTAVAQGDFARTSGGLANQQRILKAELDNLRATIGTGLIPVVAAGAKALTSFLGGTAVQNGAKKLSDALGNMGGALQALFSGDNRGFMLGFTQMFSNLGQIFGMTGTQGAQFGTRIMNALGPLGATVQRLFGYFQQFFGILTGSGGDMSKIGAGLGGLLTQILGDTASARAGMLTMGLNLLKGLVTGITSALPQLIPAATSILQGLINAVTTALPVLLQAGFQILQALIAGVVRMLPQLVQTGVQLLMTLIQGIVNMLPALISAGVQILVSLAQGLSQALPTLIPVIVGIIPQIILILLQNLPLLVQAALQLITALAQGLIAALPILIPYIPQIIMAIVNALIAALPMIYQAAVQLNTSLANGLSTSVSMIVQAATQIGTSLWQTIQAFIPQLYQIGLNLVDGLWKGMAEKIGPLIAWLQGRLEYVINLTKTILGVHSPSSVFDEIGQNTALGFSQGFQKAFSGVENRIQAAVNDLAKVDLGGSLTRAYATQPVNAGPTVNMYATVYKDLDIDVLTGQVLERIQRG